MWGGVWFATCWSYLVANNASVKVSGIRIQLRTALSQLIPSQLNPIQPQWLNSFTFVLVIQSHGRRMQLLQRCEIEMACHVPGYWARTETWISLWFQLKLRGASMEAGQVCWGFIFYLLVIPSKWPSQLARRHKGCWNELQTEGHTGCWLRSQQASPSLLSKLSTTATKHMLHPGP